MPDFEILQQAGGAPLKVWTFSGEEAELRRTLPLLRARGCGAMVRSGEGCNAPTEPVALVVNVSMAYLLWRNLFWKGVVVVFLCERHQGSVDTVTRDLAPGMLAAQLEEGRQFCARQGTHFAPGALGMLHLDDDGQPAFLKFEEP